MEAEALVRLLAVSVLAGLAAISMLIAEVWILGPLSRLEELRKERRQFTLADLLCLFVLAQPPLALIDVFVPRDETAWRVSLAVIALVFFTLLWLAGIRRLSRAGIRSPFHRGLFVLVCLPVSVLGAPTSMFLLAILLGGGFVDTVAGLVILLAILAGAILALFSCRLYVRWLVARHSPTVGGDPGGSQESQAR